MPPAFSALLTAWYFAEVDELRMRLGVIARRKVCVLVTLVQPRIVVSRQTRRSNSTRLHAFLQRLELAEQLRTSLSVKAFVDA